MPTLPMPRRSASEIGTYIFAIVNIIIVSVWCLILIGGFLYFVTSMILYVNNSANNDVIAVIPFFIYMQCEVILAILALSFSIQIFGIFLLNGIIKRKAEHIKVYLIYGIVVIVLTVLGAIALLVLSQALELVTVAIVASVCCVYSLILMMINFAYKNINQGVIYQFGHKTLTNWENEQVE